MVALNSKHRTNRKQRKHRETTKLVSQKKGRKDSPRKTHIEQNNDHTRLMHKIKFRNSFN